MHSRSPDTFSSSPLDEVDQDDIAAVHQALRRRLISLRAAPTVAGWFACAAWVISVVAFAPNIAAFGIWWLLFAWIAGALVMHLVTRDLLSFALVRREASRHARLPACVHRGYSLKGLDLNEHSHALRPEGGEQPGIAMLKARTKPP